MTKHYYFVVFALLAIIFSSCSSYKKVNYFQGVDRTKVVTEAIKNYSPLTIQVGDILGVTVISPSAEGNLIFNATSTTSTGASGTDAGNNVQGYLVDQNGDVHLPLIAPVKVSGLTTSDAQALLQKYITKFLKEPVVNVRLLNFKFSVLGDVGRTGVFNIKNERITLPEALSLAGDLNITAKRENILLIREINNERKFITIDLTSTDLFNSPYYYIKNNDVLYVEASDAKYVPLSSFNRNFPIILSFISIATTLVGIFLINR